MLPIDPGDGRAVTPAQPLTDIVPQHAMATGGTIIRPGAVAWGGARDARDAGYSSCEAIEQTLTAVARDPGELPALLAELAMARLWVPLPARRGRSPTVRRSGYRSSATGVPTSCPASPPSQRLTAWVELASSQRVGDARVVAQRVVPHIVVPAAGLARRLPGDLGLAINPDSVPGIPLYPECVPHLAELAATGRADPIVVDAWIACNTSRLYTHD